MKPIASFCVSLMKGNGDDDFSTRFIHDDRNGSLGNYLAAGRTCIQASEQIKQRFLLAGNAQKPPFLMRS